MLSKVDRDFGNGIFQRFAFDSLLNLAILSIAKIKTAKGVDWRLLDARRSFFSFGDAPCCVVIRR